MLLAIGWLLPFVTMQLPELGNMLCPMHIPVLLSGFVLGPIYGLILGVLIPLSRCFIFGAPMLYPTAICMAFELATYGFVSGLLYKLFKNKMSNFKAIIISLLISMLLGRIVWGISRLFCGLVDSNYFTISLFLSGAFLTAWPGIIIQIILIPTLIIILEKNHIIDKFRGE